MTGKTLLVVGAGMSAADSITAALAAGWAVVHVFRTGARGTKIGDKFGSPSPMYDDCKEPSTIFYFFSLFLFSFFSPPFFPTPGVRLSSLAIVTAGVECCCDLC